MHDALAPALSLPLSGKRQVEENGAKRRVIANYLSGQSEEKLYHWNDGRQYRSSNRTSGRITIANCLMCDGSFELSDRIFEQRLIEDTNFCEECFKDILENDGGELDYLNTLLVQA